MEGESMACESMESQANYGILSLACDAHATCIHIWTFLTHVFPGMQSQRGSHCTGVVMFLNACQG